MDEGLALWLLIGLIGCGKTTFSRRIWEKNPVGTLRICLGEIIPEERGTSGFGYDPIFQVQDTDQTMAELTMAEKNQISHRARAALEIIPILKQRMGI